LVADDDASTRAILADMLGAWGYEVVVTSDGAEAWAVLQQDGALPLLILDWMMPGVDGVEVCRKVRQAERTGGAYIIMLTARDGSADLVAALEAGANDYVRKPFDVAELRARVGVGRRVVELQAAAIREGELRAVLQMAGAVCHEVNQPLQVAAGWSELLLADLLQGDPRRGAAERIADALRRIGELTRRIAGMSSCATKPYMGGKAQIVDLYAPGGARGE